MQVNLDVQQFAPEEISVKTVENFVVIEAKHEEKRDEHGFISRHFQRRYLLPENVRPEDIQSSLSYDGVLTVTAPKMLSYYEENLSGHFKPFKLFTVVLYVWS
ncbi:unnamed protein product, partial [Darwinula stevensoni]